MIYKKLLKQWQNAGFTDDFIFFAVMHNKALCKEMIERLLDKGCDYNALPELYILFICTDDPFDKDLPVYTFNRQCEENGELKYRDKMMEGLEKGLEKGLKKGLKKRIEARSIPRSSRRRTHQSH